MTKAAYAASKDVYHGILSKKKALDLLESQHGMNRGSASDYIVNFKKMMDGERYTRTNNAEFTEYSFSHILADYGEKKLALALKAATEHVDYYKNLKRGSNLPGIKAIINRYEKLIPQSSEIYPDEIETPDKLFEGLKKTITVDIYERNPVARKKCIEHYGVQCVVCEFDFAKVYGDIGYGFIHVHHLIPLADIKDGYEVDPIKHLRPVCPNCHAMLHKGSPIFTIEELKKKIHKN